MAISGVHLRDAKGPDGTVVYAIGDVHGRLDLLLQMHGMIAKDLRQRGGGDWRIVHLGDHVDRGPDSKRVLDFLCEAIDADPRNIMLTGNHDVGMLGFLKEPDPTGLFIRYGGIETALSYGVDLDPTSVDSLAEGHEALLDALPDRHREFLENLKFSMTLGDFFFCHAGIVPGVPLSEQKPLDLIWIRERFLNYIGPHPKVVVHGHTPVREPEIRANRINLDTGAYFTGRLTALVIDGAEKQILTVEE